MGMFQSQEKQYGSNASVGSGGGGGGEMFMALLPLIPLILPYIGWVGVIFLPFFLASGKDFASVAVWQYIVSAVVGIGIGIGTRFIPFPKKLQWLRKVILWLPIAVLVIVVAIMFATK